MGFTTTFITGFIKGLGGPDLDEFIDKLTKQVGKEIGEIVRNMVSSSGSDKKTKESQFTEWLHSNRAKSGEVLSIVMEEASTMKENGPEDSRDSLIPDYLEILNIICATIKDIGRPLVLAGFLHNENCISYWHFDADRSSEIKLYEKHPDLEIVMMYSSNPSIYILEGEPTNDVIHKLNLDIRVSGSKKLEHSLYLSQPKVKSIEEFEVKFSVPAKPAKIPFGAPAIVTMFSSLPKALKAQGLPKAKIQETLNRKRGTLLKN